MLAASLAACSGSKSAAPARADAAAAPAATDAAPVPAVEPRPQQADTIEAEHDVAGLKVTVYANRRVRLQGPDAFGGQLDQTYEDAEYFKNAVPVLSRSVTPEQAKGLAALAERLGATSPRR
jgi:hypothetical protein